MDGFRFSHFSLYQAADLSEYVHRVDFYLGSIGDPQLVVWLDQVRLPSHERARRAGRALVNGAGHAVYCSTETQQKERRRVVALCKVVTQQMLGRETEDRC